MYMSLLCCLNGTADTLGLLVILAGGLMLLAAAVIFFGHLRRGNGEAGHLPFPDLGSLRGFHAAKVVLDAILQHCEVKTLVSEAAPALAD